MNEIVENCESKDVLKNIFGFDEFRGKQQEIVDSLINGQDSLVLMPTGGGKSLCYQIPSIVRFGTGIVISPLIALMKDQVDALKLKGIEAAFLNSSISHTEQREVEKLLLQGHIKILYVSPERMLSDYFINQLKKIEISLFAIDEAHCVSQWGHDFRPEYMKLGILNEHFSGVPKIALTATAGSATRKEIISCLGLEEANIFISKFDRPNIKYSVQKKSTKIVNIQNLISFIKDEHFNECGIVYCLSRKNTELVAEELKINGFNAYSYHAGMSIKYRRRVQDKFTLESNIIIVATIAFGMGIDKPNVRFVAHMDMPKCLESYYQETGRAGRDGLPSHAWMLYGLRDLVILKKMMNSGVSSIKRRRVNEEKLDAILGFCETTNCRREVLLNYFDDEYAGPCENCDTCISPVDKKMNATEDAKLALITVYDCGQIYNVQYLVDLLMGIVSLAARKKSHISLRSFGKGENKGENYWFSVFRQLIAQGYLKMLMDGKSHLKLTSNAINILEDKEEVWLRIDLAKRTSPAVVKTRSVKKKVIRKTTSRTTSKKRSSLKQSVLISSDYNKSLFENLKQFRSELAKKRRTKSFKIFPDKTLLEMVEKRPQSLEDLEDIYGVGPKKLKKFGKIFINAIEELSN